MGHGGLRVEPGCFPERIDRLFVVEREDQPQPLVEILLRMGRDRRDRVVQGAEVRKQRHAIVCLRRWRGRLVRMGGPCREAQYRRDGEPADHLNLPPVALSSFTPHASLLTPFAPYHSACRTRPEKRTRAPFELGWRPSPASMIPA